MTVPSSSKGTGSSSRPSISSIGETVSTAGCRNPRCKDYRPKVTRTAIVCLSCRTYQCATPLAGTAPKWSKDYWHGFDDINKRLRKTMDIPKFNKQPI